MKPFHRRSIVGRNKISKDLRSTGGLLSFCADVVFDCNGHACQRASVAASLDAFLNFFYPRVYFFLIHIQKSVDLRLLSVDLIKGSFYSFSHTDLLQPDLFPQ